MELQVLLEWRTELEAKTRRLQLEEQFERIERSGQLQQPWQSGNLQQPWLQDRLGPQPGLWPGQGVPAACPVQGLPAGWTGAQLGRAQAVQIYPGQMHAARLQCEAPPQMAYWQPEASAQMGAEPAIAPRMARTASSGNAQRAARATRHCGRSQLPSARVAALGLGAQ